jgi:hypothetical protein
VLAGGPARPDALAHWFASVGAPARWTTPPCPPPSMPSSPATPRCCASTWPGAAPRPTRWAAARCCARPWPKSPS